MTTIGSYRDEPRWQAAQHEYIDDVRDGEDENACYARRVVAAYDMYVIEAEHRGTAPKSMDALLRKVWEQVASEVRATPLAPGHAGRPDRPERAA